MQCYDLRRYVYWSSSVMSYHSDKLFVGLLKSEVYRKTKPIQWMT